MYAGQLNVLHDRRNKRVCSVADGVSLTFRGVVQEPVDEYRTVGGHADSSVHIACHALIIVHDLHAASAEYIRWTDHDRIADSFRDRKRFVHSGRHAGLRHRNVQLFHHFTEKVTVFRQVDDRRGGAEDPYSVFLKLRGEIERRLSAELRDNAERFFFFVNAQHIFQCKRFKI